MPMSHDFSRRLQPALPAIAEHFGTPFHIYDEVGILAGVRCLTRGFAGYPFSEYYAVKALPNPRMLRMLCSEGLGLECSSTAELELADKAGAAGEKLFFTSNNTHPAEFAAALNRRAIINVDDISLLDKLPEVPAVLCFRFNPGREQLGTRLMGRSLEAKFGLRRDQLLPAFTRARTMGVERFGLHSMVAANVLTFEPLLDTVTMLLKLEQYMWDAAGIAVEFINAGGGLGIPYKPDEQPLDLTVLGERAVTLLETHASRTGRRPKLFLELGRSITGPHGVLVTRVINRMSKWRELAGVDAGIGALLRVAFYPDAYHHVTVHGDIDDRPLERVDIVGSLCENNDRFGSQLLLPQLQENDLLLIHDTGAHGLAMGFNYNGRLRPQELLLGTDGTVALIRRKEEIRPDYLATLRFAPNVFTPQHSALAAMLDEPPRSSESQS
jgi:diaminopimelate decarboxylase